VVQIELLGDERAALVDSPPAVNRLIGVRFLAATLYPELFPRDLRETTADFYRRFYHVDLTEPQLDLLLKPLP
jgi:iron complex transport system substrate-binding protein